MAKSNEVEKLKAMGVPSADAAQMASLMAQYGLNFGQLFKLLMLILQAIGDSGVLPQSGGAQAAPPQTLPK